MPGMETKLHAVINEPGEFKGMSSHYSGAGFSGMKFPFHGMEVEDFYTWIARARASDQVLDRDRYRELLKPSENEPAAHFALGDETLYHAILNGCVEPGQTCMDAMMTDGTGTHGMEGGHGEAPAAGDDSGHEGHDAMPEAPPADEDSARVAPSGPALTHQYAYLRQN